MCSMWKTMRHPTPLTSTKMSTPRCSRRHCACTTITAAVWQRRLNIYHIDGTLVQQLFQGDLKAGMHAIAWHAGDRATGVYIVALAGENKMHSTQKILMIK